MNLPLILLVASILAPLAIVEVIRAHRRQPFFSRQPVSGRWLRAVLRRDLNNEFHNALNSAPTE